MPCCPFVAGALLPPCCFRASLTVAWRLIATALSGNESLGLPPAAPSLAKELSPHRHISPPKLVAAVRKPPIPGIAAVNEGRRTSVHFGGRMRTLLLPGSHCYTTMGHFRRKRKESLKGGSLSSPPRRHPFADPRERGDSSAFTATPTAVVECRPSPEL